MCVYFTFFYEHTFSTKRCILYLIQEVYRYTLFLSMRRQLNSLDWNTIKKIVLRNGVFHRKPDVTEQYKKYIYTILDENKNPSDVIRCSLFPPGTESPSRLTINEFPYDIEPHIYNYILWIHPHMKTNTIEYDEIFETVRTSLNDTGILIHRNPYAARSIKGVEHYHIFSTTPPSLCKNLSGIHSYVT